MNTIGFTSKNAYDQRAGRQTKREKLFRELWSILDQDVDPYELNCIRDEWDFLSHSIDVIHVDENGLATCSLWVSREISRPIKELPIFEGSRKQAEELIEQLTKQAKAFGRK